MSDPSLYSLASRLGNFELDKATGLCRITITREAICLP